MDKSKVSGDFNLQAADEDNFAADLIGEGPEAI